MADRPYEELINNTKNWLDYTKRSKSREVLRYADRFYHLTGEEPINLFKCMTRRIQSMKRISGCFQTSTE
jgi:hypothetical protein